jgi:hypothetical protein
MAFNGPIGKDESPESVQTLAGVAPAPSSKQVLDRGAVAAVATTALHQRSQPGVVMK